MTSISTTKIRTEWSKPFIDFLESFKSTKGGFSYKRLAAFGGQITATYITVRYVTPDNLLYVLIVWLLFILLCMAVIEFKDVVQLKNGTTVEKVFKEAEYKETTTSVQDESESIK